MSIPRLQPKLTIIVGTLFLSLSAVVSYGQKKSVPAPAKPVAAQTETPAAPAAPVDIKKLFEAYTDGYIQEKVYVHLDKDSYLAGETMWMRAFLVDGTFHKPGNGYSGILYAEIRDPENQLLHRMQIIRTDSCFQASYKIPPGLSSGYYDLVFYSNLMQNFDQAFYFKKRFYIFNASDNNVVAKIAYERDTVKKTVTAKIKLAGSDGEPYAGAMVDITPFNGSKKHDAAIRSVDRDGNTTFTYKEEAGLTGFELKFNEEKPIKYQRYFKAPIFADSLDVQFMPEGGHLLAGVTQQIGFKAIGPDGKGVQISGNVQDSEGNMVGFFAASHLGMGNFMLQPKSGMKYTAEVTTQDGRIMKYDLPQVADTGIGVNTNMRGNVLMCNVFSTEGFNYDDLYIVLQCRGQVILWKGLAEPISMQLSVADLPEGILQFFIVNGKGDVFSERIVFVNKDMSPQIRVNGLRPSYGRREKVDVDLDALYNGSVPLRTQLSVSVVDTRSTTLDKSENIVSYLLLSSDIKGKIENPSYYFDRTIPAVERARNADLLMMTQGWKRFDLKNAFSRKRPSYDYSLELSQNITGNIKPLWRKTTDSGQLILVGINQNAKFSVSRIVAANENGDFGVSLKYPRGTTFVLQGTQGNGRRSVEVDLEYQKFRDFQADRLNGRYVYKPEAEPVDSVGSFFQSIGRKYYYENGERVFALDVVNVVARKEGDWQKEMYDDMASNRTGGTALVEQGYGDLRSWLESVGLEIREGGDSVMDEQILIRNFSAQIWVDGLRTEAKDLLRFPMQEIEDIWVIKDPVSLAMVTGNAIESDMNRGGIIVMTKGGAGISVSRKETLDFFQFSPLGYSVPDEFYSPKYDGTDNEKVSYDERTTVYWNPNLMTGPDGKTNFSFYTTDVPTDFLMIIQGVSGDGFPIYAEIPIKSSF